MDALAVEELRKRYGEVHALDGVSFRVHAGQVFGLLGPNGAGESTTVKVLATLTKPDSGRAEVEGHATMLAIANFIGLPLFFLSSTLISIRQIPHWLQLAAQVQPGQLGRDRGAPGRSARDRLEHGRRASRALARALGRDYRVRDLDLRIYQRTL
jgi:energy-coupling factor transporter ATP-binding protein EcfA2